MRITLGHRYRRRDGITSGIVATSDEPASAYPFVADGHTYTPEGRFNASGLPSPYDLVGRAQPRAADKLICDMTLSDYRRGVRIVMYGTEGSD